MNRQHEQPLKDHSGEKQLFFRRSVIGFILIVIIVALIAIRYLWLQVVNHEDFTARSENNRVRVVSVPPNRGIIYDRKGRMIADNELAYRLEVVPEKAGDLEDLLDHLGEVIELSEDDRQRFLRIRNQYRVFDGIPIKLDLSEQETARFAVNRHLFDGVEVVPYLSRRYPFDQLLTHVVGYVGRLDEDDLRSVDASNYRGTSHIGKTGIEKFYEPRLHGQSGIERVETNAQGRVLEVLERQDPVHGEDLILSLDLDVQMAAWEALGDNHGSVIAIDPRDASVLAMVSKPSFNPNLFVHGISSVDYQAILNEAGRPLFNRALRGAYEPGSTLKPFVGLAGLELGVVDESHRVFSNGKFFLPGQERPYRDWNDQGHGWVDIRGALAQSVNTYFYQLALDLGIDRMHDYLQQFGFGEVTGIDLLGESKGILPSRDWKRGRYSQPWYPGETVIAGIGQGFNVVTPLQLASGLATLVNGGERRAPRLLHASKAPEQERLLMVDPPVISQVPVVAESNWTAIIEGMVDVVNSPAGTARGIAVGASYLIAGKSGTAQVFGLEDDEEYEESEVAAHLRHHALFIAYAPVENPSIVVAVVVEHGGGGSRVAAPVARAVLDAWVLSDTTTESDEISPVEDGTASEASP